LGLIYCQRGDPELSQDYILSFFDGAIKAYPEDRELIEADYSFAMGLVDIKQENIDAAKARLEGLKSLLSGAKGISSYTRRLFTIKSNYLAAEIVLKEGDSQKAIKFLETLSDETDGIPGLDFATSQINLHLFSLKDFLARAYEQAGDLPRAFAEYEKAVTFDPNSQDRRLINALYHYRLAKLYEKKGAKAKAAARYRRFLELWKDADPGTPEVEDAKARLEALRVR